MLEIMNQQNIWPDVILIQESWLRDDDYLNMIQIEGYTCINQGYKCSRHGGLVIGWLKMRTFIQKPAPYIFPGSYS